MTNTKFPTVYDVIIIGSGISGLTAANHAQKNGLSCLVLDKGRRIGGRCSTKRAGGAIFNHGAQFFTAKDPEFAALTQQALSSGAVSLWEFGHHAPSYQGAPSMRDFPAFLASQTGAQEALDVRQEVTITSISRQDGIYQLFDSDKRRYDAKKLIITAPAPQAAKLVAPLDPKLCETATSAMYDPCWTVMLALDAPLEKPHDPIRDKGVIGWANYEPMRDETSYQPALTIQASPEASRQMLEWQQDEVTKTLADAYEAASGSKLSYHYATSHRWLYARVLQSAKPDLPFVSDDKCLALAGDYFGNARLESAFLSGRRAAQALL